MSYMSIHCYFCKNYLGDLQENSGFYIFSCKKCSASNCFVNDKFDGWVIHTNRYRLHSYFPTNSFSSFFYIEDKTNNSVVLSLNFIPNINPSNVENKLKTMLTFL